MAKYTCSKCGFPSDSMTEMSNHYQYGCSFKRKPIVTAIAIFVALIMLGLSTDITKASSCATVYITRMSRPGYELKVMNANVQPDILALSLQPNDDGFLYLRYLDGTLHIVTKGQDGFVDFVDRQITVMSPITTTFDFVMTSTVQPDNNLTFLVDDIAVGYQIEVIAPTCILPLEQYLPLIQKGV